MGSSKGLILPSILEEDEDHSLCKIPQVGKDISSKSEK